MSIFRNFNGLNIPDSQAGSPITPSYFPASTSDSLVSPILTSSPHTDRMDSFLLLQLFFNDILTASPAGYKLNSFIPILELLGPKFVLDQSSYYIHGVVDDNDLAILWDYSSMVTELVLDSDVENVKPNIAPSTFIHLAQLLKPNSPLLPSLLCLRIIQADTHFPYLHLLHTPSLKTLEATNVPEHQHPTFFSFLTTLVHKAPLLEDIILGPGLFPSRSLQTILKFTHLHQLELRDAASTMDFTFLQDVGALPGLETFILDARSCQYTSRIQEKQFATPPREHTEINSSSDIGGDVPSSDRSSYINTCSPIVRIHEDDEVNHSLQRIYNQIPCDTNSSTSTVGGFHQLKRFHFIGGLPLIQDMISYIASSTLEDISITVTSLSPQDLKQEAEIEAENLRQVEAEERKREADRETFQSIVAMEKTMKKERFSKSKKVTFERQAIWKEAEIQWKEQEAQYQEIEERKTAERVQNRTQATFDLHTALYITVLQTVSSRWSADLKTVKLNQVDGSSEPLSIPPVLPKEVYGTLFCHPKIEILEFKRWKLDSVDDFLFSLKTSGPKKLKQLYLPIDDPDSAISLSGLLDIAEACPMLESLQCSINTLPSIPEYSIPTTKALSHGLQVLTVTSNPTSFWDFSQLLLVARHLYLVFPHLQTIDNMEGPNADSEQWVRIRDLIKMFQTIREDDRSVA